MSEQNLRQQLQTLTAELQSLPADSPRRIATQGLIADIEARLQGAAVEATEEQRDPIDALVDQVETAVSEFEVEHPRIAAILNNIMVTLTGMGI